MAQTRFKCSLTRADEPVCGSYARVTILDSEGAAARGCPRHAVAALDGISGAHVDWADSKGLNEWECKALELSEERSKLGYGTNCVEPPDFGIADDLPNLRAIIIGPLSADSTVLLAKSRRIT